MKSVFSTLWNRSTQPRKQRKFRHNAPYHIASKFMRAPLSKELRTKHNIKTLRVRTGDKVRILRGQFKGKTGTVSNVDATRNQVFVSGAEITKKEGGKIPYPINPSNVMLTTLVDDKKRFSSTKTSTKKAPAKKSESKPAAKAAPKKEETKEVTQ